MTSGNSSFERCVSHGISWCTILLTCLLGTTVSCNHSSVPATTVCSFVTGQEQRVIDEFSPKRTNSSTKSFSNELDRALHALTVRAYPVPSLQQLAKQAVASICSELSRQNDRDVSSEVAGKWRETVVETRSFKKILEGIGGNTLTPQRREKLVRAGLVGMLKATGLGPEWLVTGQQAKQLKRLIDQRKTGVQPGLVGIRLDHWPRITVLPDSPAADAGLKDGDVVVGVNDTRAEAIGSPHKAGELIRGPAGETVAIDVLRNGSSLSFAVRRVSTAAAMVKARQVGPNCLLVSIPSFEGSGVADKVEALARRIPAHKEAAIILDLRNNPGGQPEQANGVASIFLDGKRLEILRFRDGRQISFVAKPGRLDVKVIVLANRFTGSAAEMLILALRRRHETVIVGERTAGILFGKDYEQLGLGALMFFRSDPVILSPDGEDYSGVGIPPDVPVADRRKPDRDDVLEEALRVLRHREH